MISKAWANSKPLIGVGLLLIVLIVISVALRSDTGAQPTDEERMEGTDMSTPDITSDTNNDSATGADNAMTGDSDSTNVMPVQKQAPQSAASADRILLFETETGSQVTVSATLSTGGYVAIYEVGEDGGVEAIGHSKYLDPGSYTTLKLQLTKPIAWRQTIIATLQSDDGDKQFESTIQDPYIRTGGHIVVDSDVVDVPFEKEAHPSQGQIEAYLEGMVQ